MIYKLLKWTIYLNCFLVFSQTSTTTVFEIKEQKNGTKVTKNNFDVFDKDQEPINLKNFSEQPSEKYTGTEFQYSEPIKPKPTKKPEVNLGSINALGNILRILGIVLIIAIVAYVAYMIMNKEGSWKFGLKTEKKVINLDTDEQDIEHVDFEALIKDAVKRKDYRLGVRYYYLYLLQFLSNKELIKYDPDKTNLDYYNELHNEEQKKGFSYLSYIYNYVWYGEFQIEESGFRKATQSFKNFIHNI